MGFHFHEALRGVQFIETEGRMLVAGRGEWKLLFNECRFTFAR